MRQNLKKIFVIRCPVFIFIKISPEREYKGSPDLPDFRNIKAE